MIVVYPLKQPLSQEVRKVHHLIMRPITAVKHQGLLSPSLRGRVNNGYLENYGIPRDTL
jgi:hypothetical protein